MGGGSSRKRNILKCPKDCERAQFRTICKLFDRLDIDGDQGVCVDELSDVAVLHVQNRIQKIKERNKYAIQQQQYQAKKIIEETKQMVEDLNKELTHKVENASKEIKWLESLDETGKTEEFLKALKTKEGNVVDFWTFYDYMKTRTGDIKNIKH